MNLRHKKAPTKGLIRKVYFTDKRSDNSRYIHAGQALKAKQNRADNKVSLQQSRANRGAMYA